MYTKNQIEKLLTMIEAIQGAEQDKESGVLTKLREEAARLKAMKQRLMLGIHEHKRGQSEYLFLVPAEKGFGTDDFIEHLQDDYEPDLEEGLGIITMNDPIEIE